LSNYSKVEVARQANELGFIRDTFEKTKRLTDILAFFNTDPVLSRYLALKGGTASLFSCSCGRQYAWLDNTSRRRKKKE
jgi:hypothetical protein